MAEFHQKNVEAAQLLLRSDNRNEHVISASINFNQILSDREDLIEFNRRENLKTIASLFCSCAVNTTIWTYEQVRENETIYHLNSVSLKRLEW
jgi:hypothetical protein